MADRKNFWFNFCIFLIVILAIYIRINVLIHNFSLWHDECALAYNIKFKTFSGLFAPLDFNQMTPPFFTIATKIMTKIFGFKEYVYRIIPFLFGCATLPAFYMLCKKILNKKFSIIIAFALFALNTNLIKYSCEFKPYILDVFFAIICLIFFLNLDLKSISPKKTLIYGILLTFLPWFSLPSVFVISAGMIVLFFKPEAQSYQLTKKLILTIPIALSLLIYLKIFILNNYSHSNYLLSFWDIAFLNKSANSMLYVLLVTFDYLFQPIRYTCLASIFLIFGFGVMFKHKKEFAKISFLTLVLLLSASHFNIYPFASRLTLFIFPILLLILLKPIDFISFRWKPQPKSSKPDAVGLENPTYLADLSKVLISVLLIAFYLTAFWAFPQRVFSSLSAKIFDRKEYPREMTAFVMEKIKPADKIYVNNSSDADFAYYSSFYKFKNRIIQEKILENITKDEYFKKLNALPKGNYWIFAPVDFINVEVYPRLSEWALNKKILYCKKNDKNKHSLILYIEIK
jgi:hypothetical protein